MTHMVSRRHILAGITASTATLAYGRPVSAHRQMQAISVITWNEATKNLEIIHTLHLHDVEQALTRLGLIDKPDLTPLKARASLALYTQEHFSLRTLNGDVLPLNIVGAEIDSTYAYIYQEAPLKAAPKGLKITNTLLQETYPDQANQVNITLSNGDGNSDTKSLIFRFGDTIKEVRT